MENKSPTEAADQRMAKIAAVVAVCYAIALTYIFFG